VKTETKATILTPFVAVVEDKIGRRLRSDVSLVFNGPRKQSPNLNPIPKSLKISDQQPKYQARNSKTRVQAKVAKAKVEPPSAPKKGNTKNQRNIKPILNKASTEIPDEEEEVTIVRKCGMPEAIFDASKRSQPPVVVMPPPTAPIINVTVQQPAGIPASAGMIDHESYVKFRQLDTDWAQQQTAFAHTMYTGVSVTKPGVATNAVAKPSMSLFDHPELMLALAAQPEIWKSLKDQPAFFLKLLANPESLLASLSDDLQRKALQTVLQNPEFQDLMF
jgi:hypothetical protein